ncbi:MAG: prepilin-type N-terminal cleavage/methylation domain-containing protein [Candidatus Omnitrophota bacterium]|jgi:type II secretion system protein G|nr:MAG: prepilin-type N-terminal cleavage/methylation domain-containing protein [Candidatus Omnitrophota bacterium]
MRKKLVDRFAFTLIELLIVVAIIGILAAIAVPNFINARMRATIARMEADMKALGDALLMYRVDNRCYFEQMGSNPHQELQRLTTPVSYIAAIPHDPYRGSNAKYVSTTQNYDYSSYGPSCKTDWLLHGIGPDTDEDISVGTYAPQTADRFKTLLYQISNGLVSSGDVIHTSWRGISF